MKQWGAIRVFLFLPTKFTETMAYTGGYGGTTYYNGSIASDSFNYSSGGPSSYSYSFAYDYENRMIFAQNSANSSYSYGTNLPPITYDHNGNIIGGSNMPAFTYNGSNIPTGPGNIQHDNDGNITSTQNVSTTTYDPFTLMTMSMNKSGTTVNYQYDGRKERVLKTVNGTMTLYLRGTSDYPLEQQTGSATKYYIYGPTGLVAVNDGGTNYFVVKDHLGSIHTVLNSGNGAISWHDYNPYGQVLPSTVTENVGYRFTGQEMDGDLVSNGLYNFRAREYDGTLGIFYASDPADQTFSRYMYCGGNPTMFTDPTGRIFGIDDLIVSGLAFIEGYVQYGISTHHWGGAALGNGLITATVAEGSYLTGGLISNGLIVTGASASVATAVGGGTAGAVSNTFNGGSQTAGFLGGFAGGFVQGLIPNAAGAFLGGFTSGAVGTMAENGSGVMRNGLVGGTLSLADYDIESAIRHARLTGDPNLDKNRQAIQEMLDYQKATGYEAGAAFYKNGNMSGITESTESFNVDGGTLDMVDLSRYNTDPDVESTIHTHPNFGGPSDVILSDGQHVGDVPIMMKYNMPGYVVDPFNITYYSIGKWSTWNTNDYLMSYHFNLSYFGRR